MISGLRRRLVFVHPPHHKSESITPRKGEIARGNILKKKKKRKERKTARKKERKKGGKRKKEKKKKKKSVLYILKLKS